VGIYTTVALVRAEPEVPDAAPPSDAELEALIAQAEDQVDDWLGAWPIRVVGPSAGRKIVQAEVVSWQWNKLQRAVTRLAARLHVEPALLRTPEWDSVSGPDFSRSGHRGMAARLPDVAKPLNTSGLRNLGARATP
jgi:hypothetical protein